MKDWVEIIQGKKEACDEFLNRNTFPEDRNCINGIMVFFIRKL